MPYLKASRAGRAKARTLSSSHRHRALARRRCASVAPQRSAPSNVHATTVAEPDANGAMAEPKTASKPAQQPRTKASHGPSEKGFEAFKAMAKEHNLVPVYTRMMSDQLTPVVAYQRLVGDDRYAPSFLFESVQNGTDSGRFSFVGAWPDLEILAKGNEVTVLDHCKESRTVTHEDDPLDVAVEMSRQWTPAAPEGLPDVFTGGWVGFVGYDTVRYTYPQKIPFESAPEDDRNLLDLHLALYKDMAIFDGATKLIYLVSWVKIEDGADMHKLYNTACDRLIDMETTLNDSGVPLKEGGAVAMNLSAAPRPPDRCNTNKEDFLAAVETTKEHIRAGDVFQLVLSQRFERSTYADPFDIYRSLRIVNPSPYMVYLQARSCIMVASSPEILCRVDQQREVTNRPLAGTRKRGATEEEDASLEADLLADSKERAEHIMLVDLGRNDVGRVAEAGSVNVEKLMEVERYSHVMHISSTVKGELKSELDAWDALRATLPVGTISGAPKVRAMQIIDELEENRRGPYGGGFGHVSFSGAMDIALALRTMVIPSDATDSLFHYKNRFKKSTWNSGAQRQWDVHIQAGAGLVADSDPESEFQECVNKANAMSRAVDVAEHVFSNTEEQ